MPEGLFGAIANVRVLIQRESVQGDCRFGPQGYPAQLLGSSAVSLTNVDGTPHDFSARLGVRRDLRVRLQGLKDGAERKGLLEYLGKTSC